MPKRISLALIFHNHQPVGNFGWVIEDVYEKAYGPMIGALARHPAIRVGLHYSGPLLEWMAAERPDSIVRLRALVERDQVEILGGGMFEPILPALPERDRLGQLVRMRDGVEQRFGRAPTGAWLAERVWEPSVPATLADAGYAYTVLDDNHLRGAFVPEDQMWGTYTTDDQGRLLTIFGTEKGLRYRIPWRPVEDLIEYLRENATEGGDRLGVMGDDGEKFGAWPGTDRLCWGDEAWVERCFTALEENAEWLRLVTPAQWMADHPPIGRIYIPTSSYVEMTEWALPADEAPTFHAVLEEASEQESPALPFLRGAMWRNFQARYREVNDLHKQMLRVSSAVVAMPAGPDRERALDHLYRGQSNDCYWHGLFGGIYIVHMRMATLAQLIAAEDIALGDSVLSGIADYDLDGIDEVALGTVGQTVIVDVAEGAGIGSWDLRASRVALASVLRRRPEAYHSKLRESAVADTAAGPSTPTSPHDVQQAKEAGLAALLVYDDHERRSGLVRVLGQNGAEMGDFPRGAWEVEQFTDQKLICARTSDGLSARKTISLDGGRMDGSLALKVELRNESAVDFVGVLELEWNLNVLGGGANPAAYYRFGAEETRHDARGSVKPVVDLDFGNEHEGVDVTVTPSPPAAQQWFPVETVSQSESGYERVYQGSCLTQRWPIRLATGKTLTFATTLRFTQSRDRSLP